MNTRLACLVFALVCGCGPKAPEPTGPEPLADADGNAGAGSAAASARAAEVQQVIDAEERALAELDAKIAAADGDQVTLRQDRAARASFVAHLRRCKADVAACPASFAEPVLEAADWTTIAATACACRTRACADWVYEQVSQWDAHDEAAAAVTAARECAHDRIYGY